jgi:alpha-1,2-mannosyltransferase
MHRALQALRSGDWLTRERIRLVAVTLLITSVAGFLLLIATAHDGIDRQGRPLGTDFSNVYAAGTYVREGNPDAPFDPPQQYAREQAIFGKATQFYGWHYPPYFLFIAGALAKMPYGLALTVWQTSTLALYLLTIWAIVSPLLPSPLWGGSNGLWPFGVGVAEQKFDPTPLPPPLEATSPTRGEVTRLWLILALAYPAVLINIGHGQNGFLTAALLGGALVMLDRRPIIAGILIGLLVYKPQFGLMIPLALIAGGRWRTFAAAAVTVALLTLATTVAFGPEVWHAFLLSTKFSRTVVLEQGNTGWQKIQSVFSWARMWGASIPLAYALQGTLTVALGIAIVRLWRSTASSALKSAALCLAGILATPYSLDYDMMVLAPAIAFFAADGLVRGFGPWERTALAALWLAPLVTRSVAQATLIPLGVPAMLTLFVLLLRRAELDCSVPVTFAGASSTIGDSGQARGHDIAAFEQ